MPQLDIAFFVPQIFWLIVVFATLYIFMAGSAAPKIAGVLKKRQDAIAGDLVEAEKLQAKAESARVLYEKSQSDARSNVAAMVLSKREELKDIAEKEVPSATETMNQKNINMGLRETIEISCKIIETAKKANLKTRGYVAVAWECPFEGKVQESIVLDIANQMLGAGVDEIILADTIGAANPSSVASLFNKCVSEFDHQILSAHFHDTRAMALANVCAAS